MRANHTLMVKLLVLVCSITLVAAMVFPNLLRVRKKVRITKTHKIKPIDAVIKQYEVKLTKHDRKALDEFLKHLNYSDLEEMDALTSADAGNMDTPLFIPDLNLSPEMQGPELPGRWKPR